MRRRKKMLKKMLSAVLAAAIVLTSGAFQASTCICAGSGFGWGFCMGTVWKLYCEK